MVCNHLKTEEAAARGFCFNTHWTEKEGKKEEKEERVLSLCPGRSMGSWEDGQGEHVDIL